jgi:hypothetical protein
MYSAQELVQLDTMAMHSGLGICLWLCMPGEYTGRRTLDKSPPDLKFSHKVQQEYTHEQTLDKSSPDLKLSHKVHQTLTFLVP